MKLALCYVLILLTLAAAVPCAAVTVQNQTTATADDGSGSYYSVSTATWKLTTWTPNCGTQLRSLLQNQFFSNCYVSYCAQEFFSQAEDCIGLAGNATEMKTCCSDAMNQAASCLYATSHPGC